MPTAKHPKHHFIATFPAGCFDVVARQFKKFSIDQLALTHHDESSVAFTAALRPERLIELRFFTNIFLVLDPDKLAQYRHFIKGDSFRLMALKQGEPVAVAPTKRAELASRIRRTFKLGASGRYTHDFVLLTRTGTPQLLTLRLPRPKHKRTELPAGALRPELAHILLLIAGIKPTDVLLDPFAGYGTIPTEAQAGFGVKHIYAIEKDPVLANLYNAQPGDATDLVAIANHSVHKIVTDPPWGQFQPVDHKLYEQALQEFYRVLKAKGTMVILSGSPALDKQLQETKQFHVLKKYPILVSGKKATIHKLQK